MTKIGRMNIKMINKITKKQINGAFEYFMDTGRLEELNSDDIYYLKVLLKTVANQYSWKLIFEEEKENDK